jgi:tRNA-2-methylthio-N6-dimethylallyladenosine synthase
MNVHDAKRMQEVLGDAGYETTTDPASADVVIVNTCSVRAKSYDKVISAVGRLGQFKQANPNLILAVAGCVAQQEGQRLLDAAPSVDLVFSPDHISILPALIEGARAQRTVQTGFVDPTTYRFLTAVPAAAQAASPTALVTIQKGCDNSCSYCIVPSVRGPAVSRPRDEILSEIQALVASGTCEVTLIGQNVNSYHGGSGSGDDFIELLTAVDSVEGLRRLRFTTSHPKDVHPELAGCYANLDSLCPWLHLPVQSGSSRVLGLMNRGYTRGDYVEHVRCIRARCPDLSLGTDLIVGYPGETEEDFLETISLLEEIQFDYAYSFKFSARPGTHAEHLSGELAEEEKAQRLAHLQRIQDAITVERLKRWVGQRVDVLVEGPSRRGGDQRCGRSPGNQVVNFEGQVAPGQLITVRISAAGKHSLHGTIEAGH